MARCWAASAGGSPRAAHEWALIALTLAAITFLSVPVNAGAEKKDDVGTQQRRLRQTQKQLLEQREKAAEARRKEVSLLAELELIDQTLARKRQEVTKLTARIERARSDVVTLRGEIRRLEGRRALQQDALARRLRAMYHVRVQGGALPVILAGDDPVGRAVLLRHLTTLATVEIGRAHV